MQLQRALPARDRPAQPVAVSPADGAADLLPLNPGLGSPPNRDAAWRPTSVPAGWEPVSVACLSLHLGLPDLVRRITDCIYEEIPSYQENRIARADLEASVAANTDATLIGVAARREPSAEELEWRFRLGRKRAEQGMPAEDVVKAFHIAHRELWEELVTAAVAGASVALGLDRIGLPGARLSLADAERTLAVTTPAATGRYSELWFLAALKRDGETVPAILQRGIRVVQERPHLAVAVRALLDCGFSHQRAGRRLCVHPNTVAYRVERWRELTGWEIGRSQGLRLTMAALAWTEGETVNADPRPGSL